MTLNFAAEIIEDPEEEQSSEVLTREWYVKLESQAAVSFINLPMEFQLKGYDYNFISKSYLNFFDCKTNSRSDKLTLARKFLTFISSINRNRAKEELGEEFFECFNYFMENFNDLLSKQDLIHLSTLTVLEQAIDKSKFVEEVISLPELQKRVQNLEVAQDKEEIINLEWEDFTDDYALLNNDTKEDRDKYLLINKIEGGGDGELICEEEGAAG